MDRLSVVLLNAGQRFADGWGVYAVARWLVGEMDVVRRMAGPQDWPQVAEAARNHPIARILLEDPFTRWSFEKPRGYSGDAHLLDFVYGHPNVEDAISGATPFGQSLCAAVTSFKACSAVRERREILAAYVDEIASARPGGAELLAIAAGHLREAAFSTALRTGGVRRWVALDQDPLSVAAISRDHAGTAIQPREDSVRGLLQGGGDLGEFDFVYAAGLYDYLPHPVAVRLTRRCLRLLKPGGKFLFANFSEETEGAGYMESFMRWTLLLRSEDDMWKVARESVGGHGMKAEVYPGENGNVLYGVIERT